MDLVVRIRFPLCVFRDDEKICAVGRRWQFTVGTLGSVVTQEICWDSQFVLIGQLLKSVTTKQHPRFRTSPGSPPPRFLRHAIGPHRRQKSGVPSENCGEPAKYWLGKLLRLAFEFSLHHMYRFEKGRGCPFNRWRRGVFVDEGYSLVATLHHCSMAKQA
jgi:hypothetical protein